MAVWTEGKIVSSADIWSDSQRSADEVREGKWTIGRTKCRNLEETIRSWGGFLPRFIVIIERANDFRITDNLITQRGGYFGVEYWIEFEKLLLRNNFTTDTEVRNPYFLRT